MKKLNVLMLVLVSSLVLSACSEETANHELTLVVDGEPYLEETVEADGFIPETIPEHDSLSFKAWTLDEAGKIPAGFPLYLSTDTTLYAQFETPSNESDDILAILERAKRFTPMIDSYNNGVLESGGSGVVYKKEGNTYYLLTNQHVVDGYSEDDFELTFFMDTEQVIEKGTVSLHGTSVTHDLAVMTFESSMDIPVAEFADSLLLKPGQTVYALGSPLDLPNTLTMGIISATNRAMSDEYGMNTTTIQHTASINAGNSGGALVNEAGEVVGINVMSYVDEYVGEGIEGLHFAVQSNVVESVLPSLEDE